MADLLGAIRLSTYQTKRSSVRPEQTAGGGRSICEAGAFLEGTRASALRAAVRWALVSARSSARPPPAMREFNTTRSHPDPQVAALRVGPPARRSMRGRTPAARLRVAASASGHGPRHTTSPSAPLPRGGGDVPTYIAQTRPGTRSSMAISLWPVPEDVRRTSVTPRLG